MGPEAILISLSLVCRFLVELKDNSIHADDELSRVGKATDFDNHIEASISSNVLAWVADYVDNELCIAIIDASATDANKLLTDLVEHVDRVRKSGIARFHFDIDLQTIGVEAS